MSQWNEKMEAALRAAAPVSFARAEELASELGVTTRAVTSKVKSMGLEYIPKPKTGKRNGVKKANLIVALEAAYGRNLDGLGFDKLNMAGLAFLIQREQSRANTEEGDASTDTSDADAPAAS